MSDIRFLLPVIFSHAFSLFFNFLRNSSEPLLLSSNAFEDTHVTGLRLMKRLILKFFKNDSVRNVQAAEKLSDICIKMVRICNYLVFSITF